MGMHPWMIPSSENSSSDRPFREFLTRHFRFPLMSRMRARYASGMSRTVVAHEPRGESFSGLLERLARRVGEDAGTESKSNSARKSTPRAGIASEKQPVAQASRADTKNRVAGDALPLSYEKALEMHRRRGKTSLAVQEAVFPATSTGQAEPQEANRSHQVKQEIPREFGSAAPVSEARPAQQSPRKRSKAKKAEPPLRSKTKRRSEALPRGKNATLNDALRGVARSREAQLPPAGLSFGRVEIQAANPGGLIGRGYDSLALEQRRTIVSVRLSEQESDKLRQRAAESGISVSAYMRSCVLDADHLRDQVKRALEEMRAGVRQPIQLAARAGEVNGNVRSSVLSRFAALFLRSLFSFRHRAKDRRLVQ
jgi:hypothetical protein